MAALTNYSEVDLNKYIKLIEESLQYLKPGNEILPDIKPEKRIEETEKTTHEEINEDSVKKSEKQDEKIQETKEESDEDSEDIENTVLETIKKIEGKDGAAWDTITEKCEKAGLDKDSIEEALNSLMDKGLIYEPILGTIKTT